MSDSDGHSRLRVKRDALGLGREKVAAQLDPPISSKTLERWEDGSSPVKRWRLNQLASVYGCDPKDLMEQVAA